MSRKAYEARIQELEEVMEADKPSLATVSSAESVRSGSGQGLAMLPYLTINDIMVLRHAGFDSLEDLEARILEVPDPAWEHVVALVRADIIRVKPGRLEPPKERPPEAKAQTGASANGAGKGKPAQPEPEPEPVRCLGLTRSGDRCRNNANDGVLFCTAHTDYEPSREQLLAKEIEGSRCLALTKSGERCQNSARHGSKYCSSHKGYQPTTEELTAFHGEGSHQCLALTKSGKPCQNQARGGSKYCSSHKGYQPSREELDARRRGEIPG